MTSRTQRVSLFLVALLALSGCAAQGGTDYVDVPAAMPGGAIELAVSETCVEGSDPDCILVNDQYVLKPTAFERASVEDAAVAEAGGQNAVDVTFTDEGAVVLNALTEEAAGAGEPARLVMKIGPEIRSAVFVAEPLIGNQIMIALSPDDNAQETVDLINGG
ncbi:hypothetical protein FB472_1499 [Rhodoglobus vestalii]|uniref:Preprotein translocase subunit SecD n=1 Tax=Rhodoglobus vestalii TaxID=193384 RepID=A0A8H2PYN1_9MICO|nr:hypothetical protein [Rhodoglobus vestalii]TQO19898.1 hypothetical protein FB472_1499 [Rhodoglobus vestalii]